MIICKRREPSPASQKRILIIEDDSRIVRAWTRALHAAGFDVEVATTLKEANELELSSYTVVLLDLRLPDGHGSLLLPRLRVMRPRPAVAIVSGFLDSETAANHFGSYDVLVPKPVSSRNLIELVSALATTVVPASWMDAFCTHHGLSPREAELLQAVAEGLTNAEIAERLGCQPGTVKTYWRRIKAKTATGSEREVLAAVLSFAMDKMS